MLASLQILVVTAVITSLIYHALPNRWVEVRRVLVLGVIVARQAKKISRGLSSTCNAFSIAFVGAS